MSDGTGLVHGWDSIEHCNFYSFLGLSTHTKCKMLPNYDKAAIFAWRMQRKARAPRRSHDRCEERKYVVCVFYGADLPAAFLQPKKANGCIPNPCSPDKVKVGGTFN